MNTMATFLFDLGNTRLKFAELGADGQPGETTAVAHDGDVDHGWLDDLPRGDVACVASVGPAPRQLALLDALATRFTRLHVVRTQETLGRLRIAYPNPQHLGVDRFLAMLAALEAGPVLVVGVGTALTCDLLDGDGQHRGGRIAPSPMLMRVAGTRWPLCRIRRRYRSRPGVGLRRRGAGAGRAQPGAGGRRAW